MPAQVDALAEIDQIDLADDAKDAATKRNGINTEQNDIAADRESIQEISRMADRMTLMIQEIRNTNVEADERLRKVEADLKLIELEQRDG